MQTKVLYLTKLIFIQFMLFYFGKCTNFEIEVDLPNGKVLGLEKYSAQNQTFYAFLQIPYAQPPIGELRFQEPRPVKNWNGTFDARVERTICYQFSRDLKTESEDCLYVNVYTPVHPKNCYSNKTLPVMFYIHGGGFLNGDSLFTTIGPHFFMDKNVIVITVSYRLGPFGFLSTEDNVIPGNYGLKDQNFALKWVKENIKNFGGDPTKVTIFGQSSGAVSVGYHVLSKQSSELFRAAIGQSGSSLTPHGYQRKSRSFAYQLANFVNPNFTKENSSEDLLQLLRNTPAKDIDTATKLFNEKPGGTILSEGSWFAPVIEKTSSNAFIIERMFESVKNGNVNRVPLMLGMTSEEALSSAENLTNLKFVIQPYDNNVAFLTHGDMHIENEEVKKETGLAIRRIYTDGLFQDDLAATVRYFSDAYVSRPIIKNAELQSQYSAVYFYQFSYHGTLGNNNIHVKGADKVTHSEDTRYLWVTGDVNIRDINDKDLTTVERYVKLLTDFCKYRNPTPKQLKIFQNVLWPKILPNRFSYLNIGENLEIKLNPKETAYKGWVEIYKKIAVPPFDTY